MKRQMDVSGDRDNLILGAGAAVVVLVGAGYIHGLIGPWPFGG